MRTLQTDTGDVQHVIYITRKTSNDRANQCWRQRQAVLRTSDISGFSQRTSRRHATPVRSSTTTYTNKRDRCVWVQSQATDE